jgi:RNA-splicing ligase RtcB
MMNRVVDPESKIKKSKKLAGTPIRSRHKFSSSETGSGRQLSRSLYLGRNFLSAAGN